MQMFNLYRDFWEVLQPKNLQEWLKVDINPAFSILIVSFALSELESQILQLGPDFFSEEPDLSEDLLALDINYNQVYYQLQSDSWNILLGILL